MSKERVINQIKQFEETSRSVAQLHLDNAFNVSKEMSKDIIDTLIRNIARVLTTNYEDTMIEVWNKDTVNPANVNVRIVDQFKEYAIGDIYSHITRKNHINTLNNKIAQIVDYAVYYLLNNVEDEEDPEEEAFIERVNNNLSDIRDIVEERHADIYDMSIVQLITYLHLLKQTRHELEKIVYDNDMLDDVSCEYHKTSELLCDIIYEIEQMIRLNDDQEKIVLEKARATFKTAWEFIDGSHKAEMEDFRKSLEHYDN